MTETMNDARLIELVESRMPFPATVTMDSNLFDDLGFDSVLLLDLIVGIEEECSFEFSESALSMDALDTPRKLLALILSCKGEVETS